MCKGGQTARLIPDQKFPVASGKTLLPKQAAALTRAPVSDVIGAGENYPQGFRKIYRAISLLRPEVTLIKRLSFYAALLASNKRERN